MAFWSLTPPGRETIVGCTNVVTFVGVTAGVGVATTTGVGVATTADAVAVIDAVVGVATGVVFATTEVVFPVWLLQPTIAIDNNRMHIQIHIRCNLPIHYSIKYILPETVQLLESCQ
ncbi:hypothetical protein ccbrp13_51570 [Ktedonobacteria bacterium brp13]|nr:hypothetical protein ccbrp13_51570 [Ktedonobacteria bacterium brp13]